MSFYDMPPVPTADQLLDIAFSRAKRAAEKKQRSKETIIEQKERDILRFDSVSGNLQDRLQNIISSFPSLDQLNDFYQELLRLTLDYAQFKKSLGAVNWAKGKVGQIHRIYTMRIRRAAQFSQLSPLRSEFYGRISSVIKQIKDELKYLEQARRVLKEFPMIKQMKTAAIAGFPNVGKSTLLAKLSTSKPEVAAYAFTTKNINVGYMIEDTVKMQLLDTPGTLNRFEKMNYIEQQAVLAIRHLTQIIVYVFDITEPYPLADQEKLYQRLNEENKQVIMYLSKTDILNAEQVEAFKKSHPGVVTSVSELKEKLVKLVTLSD